jgi:3-oxoacyl-[acyl-carrier protein] reductase
VIFIITGARKGLGRYLTEVYLARGHTVVGCSRGESDLCHDNYYHYQCDVADSDSVVDFVRKVAKRLGVIDVLINNAGVASMNHILSTHADTVKRLMEINFLGAVNMSREVAKVMIRKRVSGRIVNFSTVAVPLSLEGEAAYASSKAAVQKFSQISAGEFAPFGITVNCLGPTPVATDLIKAVPKAKIENLIARQALNRLGTTEDVLNVVDFFLDQKSDFITGQSVYLGGIHD